MDYSFISVLNTLKQTGSLFVNDIGTRHRRRHLNHRHDRDDVALEFSGTGYLRLHLVVLTPAPVFHQE
jgi:hypothetical protein